MTYSTDILDPYPIAAGAGFDEIRAQRDHTSRTVPIAPRTRVNVKQLANGKWQPDITVESFDADPLTDEGRARIAQRLDYLHNSIAHLLFRWHADADRWNEDGNG